MSSNGAILSHEPLPQHVQNLAIRVDAHEDVGHCDVLELGVLCVREVHFWFPYGFHQIGIVQVQRLGNFSVLESLVLPLLSQVQVNFIILQENTIYLTRLLAALRDLPALLYVGFFVVPLSGRRIRSLLHVRSLFTLF